MASQSVFAINGMVIDLENELLADASGRPVPLRRQSFAVLRHLRGRAGGLVTKGELAEAVWPGIAVTDDSLVQCVHEIRTALGDEGRAFLKTVRGRGYRLVLLPDAHEGLGTRAVASVQGLRSSRRSAALAVAIICFTIVLVPAAIDMSAQGPPTIELAGTANSQAYDALLLGLERLRLDTEEDTLTALAHFERAVRYDPEFGRAYAAIAAAQQRMIQSDWLTMAGADLDRAHAGLKENLAKAMKRPTPLAYAVMAKRALYAGRSDEAFALIGKAKALAPSDLEVLLSEASILNATGQADEAESVLRMAMRLDAKFPPATLRSLSIALFQQGKYREAAATVDRIRAQGADTTGDLITLVASLGHLGAGEGVSDAIGRYNRLAVPAGKDPMSVQEAQWLWHGDLFSHHAPYVAKLVDGLRRAGVPEGAGMDLHFTNYKSLIKRGEDGGLWVTGVTEIGASSAGALFDRGVRFVDVRPRAGYAIGHVPGAINLSLVTDLSREELIKVARPDDQIVFYCDSRYCESSAIAAAKAVRWGYTRVYRMTGGVPAWKKADCPIEVASQ
jgi:rhodanese-related sulfurtransferase/Tfp pilus assembly protein PilF